jgi:hypothetical protein
MTRLSNWTGRKRVKRLHRQGKLPLAEVFHINPRKQKMTHEEMREYIAGVRWQFAKTMPQNPHEYTLKKWAPTQQNDFEAVVMFIREHGYKKKWGKTTYSYFDVDGWQYWTMGAPLDQTILINRAKLEPAM